MANAATPGTGADSSKPRLTRFVYRVPDESLGIGSIYREFPGLDGVFDPVDTVGGDDISTVLVTNVANAHENKDVFVYSAYNTVTSALYYSSGTTPLVSPSDMVSVAINLLIDVNPGKSPNYTDVSTTVNTRNIRQF